MLITQTDARTVRALYKGFDETEFANIVNEMEEFYLMPLLGVELYQDVVDNEANYQDLLAGIIYDNGSEKVSMKGIKKYLSYLFFYKYSLEGGLKYTQSGLQNFDVDYSKQSAKNVYQDFLDKANNIGESIQTYLERNTSIYPLYKFESSIVNKDFDFQVIGKTYKEL